MKQNSEYLSAFARHIGKIQEEFAKIHTFKDLTGFITSLTVQKIQATTHLFITMNPSGYYFDVLQNNITDAAVLQTLVQTGVNSQIFKELSTLQGLLPIDESQKDKAFQLFLHKSSLSQLPFNLILPFHYGGGTINSILLFHAPQSHCDLSPDLKALFSVYQVIFASALHHTYRTEELTQRVSRLESRFRNLSLFVQTDRILESFSDVKLSLFDLLDQMRTTLNIERVSIALKDQNSEDLYIKALRGGKFKDIEEKINTGQLYDITIKQTEGIGGMVFRSGAYEIVEDVKQSPIFSIRPTSEDIQSLACFPLLNVNTGAVIGILNITNKVGSYSEENIKKIEATCELISKTIMDTQASHFVSQIKDAGIHNATMFNLFVEQEFNRSRRAKLPMTLLSLQIDEFPALKLKLTNATFKAFLQAITSVIRDFLDEADIISKESEGIFSILLTGTDQKDALYMAEKLRNTLSIWRPKDESFASQLPPIHCSLATITTSEEIPSTRFLYQKSRELLNLCTTGNQIFFFSRGQNREYVEETVSIQNISNDIFF